MPFGRCDEYMTAKGLSQAIGSQTPDTTAGYIDLFVPQLERWQHRHVFLEHVAQFMGRSMGAKQQVVNAAELLRHRMCSSKSSG